MKIDLSSVIKETGAEIGISEEIMFSDEQFFDGVYRLTKPLSVTGRIYNNGQSLTLEAEVTGEIITQCARCLDDVKADIAFSIRELMSRREEESDDSEDMILFDGYEIDLDAIVADNFIMNVSGKYLCDEDCKGLCPKCGKNLNEGECDCDNEYIDPRWQALADILNQSKED